MTVAPHDLGPPAAELGRLVAGVRDDQLDGPTPCADTTLASLLVHVADLATGLAAAGRKDLDAVGVGVRPPPPHPDRLRADFRTHIPADLAALAVAWSEPAAWEGTTAAGGIELPAAVAGLVALDELIVHGWDVARATEQVLVPTDDAAIEACIVAISGFAGAPTPPDGPFGPPVAAPADASALERLVAVTGRDPRARLSPAAR